MVPVRPLTISTPLSQVREMVFLVARRRSPTPEAVVARLEHSSDATPPTAAASRPMNGQIRMRRSVQKRPRGLPSLSANSSIALGASSEKAAHAAVIPTVSGITALTRSDRARSCSASAAACSVTAATSLPSDTATLPLYSADTPMAPTVAASAGRITSVTWAVKSSGETKAAVAAKRSTLSSLPLSCDVRPMRWSRKSRSFSRRRITIDTPGSSRAVCFFVRFSRSVGMLKKSVMRCSMFDTGGSSSRRPNFSLE
mmetsp:Transcript_37056/g.115993  ORF Transcript_37056/g.115993 Transcript_37056/m.115993 type:complete len:256 (-) Transcript_37056:300-1067(-)